MNIKHGINYDCPCDEDDNDLCDDCVKLLNDHDDNCSLCNPSIAEQEDDNPKDAEMLSQINYPKPDNDNKGNK